MCTSIAYRQKDLYFGRTLDVEFSFNEKVVITPRNYLFSLRNGTEYHNKYALIGIAAVFNDCPLYYEAANEEGLAMAGLNFPGNAVYNDPLNMKPDEKDYKDDIALFELIPCLLGQSKTVSDVRVLLERLNLTNIPFAEKFPSSPLHFMISDKKESIVVEPTEHGLDIFDNPFDVMTNNPPFQYHIYNMQRYMNVSPKNSENNFSNKYDLKPYAVGMGAEGLPGDTSSVSRFVRAAFNLTNSHNEDNEIDNISQFFHILDSVSMVKGSTFTDDGKDDITLYSCCFSTASKALYYKTYGKNQITAVKLNKENSSAKELSIFTLQTAQQINYEN